METFPDENLLEKLVSLGFEKEACEDVLNEGFVGVNEAIERLLERRKPSNDESSNDEVKETLLSHQQQVQSRCEPTTSIDQQQVQSRCEPTTSIDQQQVHSRCEPSVEQQHIKDDYLTKERMQAQISYKKHKKEKLEERKRVLQQIEQDKIERHKNLKITKKNNTSSSETPTLVQHDQGDICHLSVRLPNGKAQKLEFNRNVQLEQVVMQVFPSYFEANENIQYTILQPFPRRLLSLNDMPKTLLELRLYPSSVLVIQATEQHILTSKEEMNDDNIETKEVELTSERTEENHLLSSIKAEINKEDVVQDQETFSDASSQQKQNINNKHLLFLEAVNQRQKAQAGVHHSPQIHREIPQLQTTCAKCIAKQLALRNSSITNFIHTLKDYQARLVIQSMKDLKQLNPKVMNYFIPCKLQEMNLDYYSLCTNELVEKLRWHSSLRRLSLVSSPFITDHSLIIALKGLRHLEYLNVNDCSKLTSKILPAIQVLSSLKVLILDKIKISTDELNLFMKNVPPLLHQLSLNECHITEDAFQNINGVTSLISLSLRGTKIKSCICMNNFPNLNFISLQKTNVTDSGISCLSQLKKLKVLELTNTNVSNEGLKYLHGSQLERLVLPNRLLTDTATINAIHSLPLTILELSDHININDSSMQYICKIKSLVNLSLSNTKVTDHGLQLIEDLRDLEILDISRCNITDEVSPLFAKIKVHTLNLSHTKISDESMVPLSKCLNLQKLNLSTTLITDKGCLHLKLPYLKTLFLDYTGVSWEGARLCLKNCGARELIVRNSKYNILLKK